MPDPGRNSVTALRWKPPEMIEIGRKLLPLIKQTKYDAIAISAQ